MTALVSLDIYNKNDILTVKNKYSNGVVIGLTKGEKISVESLLFALLIPSANDAAQVLADNANEDFVNLMNEKAIKIHLDATHFSNPQGFDDGVNYSTVHDLTRLATYALNTEFIKAAVKTPTAVIENADKSKTYEIRNVNELLFANPEYQGIKTGYTEQAGECLLSLVARGNHKIIIAILKSEDRFEETQKLADWTFRNTIWLEPQKLPL